MADLIVTVVAVAIVLGADAFSLSLGMGIKGVRKSYEIKFASTVGVFHVIMPLTGLYLGLAAGKFLGIWAGRLGAVVLAYIALDMLRKAYSHSRMKSTSFKDGRKLLAGEGIPPPDDWFKLIVLTMSVSVDALTVGFSLGTFQMPIVFTVIVMGMVAGIMTFLGFKSGAVVGRMVGSYAQAVGGIILLALAFKLFLNIQF